MQLVTPITVVAAFALNLGGRRRLFGAMNLPMLEGFMDSVGVSPTEVRNLKLNWDFGNFCFSPRRDEEFRYRLTEKV